jgi:hypothetical protein
VSFLTMLNARKRTITANTPSTNGMLSDMNQSGTPVTDLVPRRFQTLCHKKLHSLSSAQTQAHIRVHRLARPTTSSFWSPPPPPTLPDEDQGYQDYLPPNLDLESGRGAHKIERSLSDDSETVRGTLKCPLSPTSPTSADTLLQSPVKRPPSIYDGDMPVSPLFRPSADIRRLSTPYPWHAR